MLSLVTLFACAPTPEPPPPAAEDPLTEAQDAVKLLATTVRGRLQAAMTEGGPAAAVKVCAEEAQALTAKVAADTGVRIGRSSLRLRNPANRAPDWVAAWLASSGEGPGAAVEGVARVEGGHARVLKPIVVEEVCLACHGPADQIPADVRALLAERYPSDAATGYAVGDLRGVVWAER